MNLPLALKLAATIEALYANDIAPNITSPRTDTQVLVEKQPDGRFAVIFPGTASLHDALTDARIHKIPWSGIGQKVHAGFSSAYASVHDGIRKILPDGARLIIAGHSLGGALATLAASALSSDYPIDGVITFGSPRVGNAKFAAAWNNKFENISARFVNAGDPVPHVPWVFATYRHVDTQIYLDRDGDLHIDEPWVAIVGEMRATVQVMQEPATVLAFTAEHGIHRYRQKLENA